MVEAAKMQNVLLNRVQHECDGCSAQCWGTQCIKDVYRYRPGNCTFASLVIHVLYVPVHW